MSQVEDRWILFGLEQKKQPTYHRLFLKVPFPVPYVVYHHNSVIFP